MMDLECRMCEKEFETIQALKDHVLQNKIRCLICHEIYSDTGYCITPDYIYVCDTCNSGMLTKRAH